MGVQSIGSPAADAEPAVRSEATANPANWPAVHSPQAITDPATEAKITALLARMTIEQKVGQLIQADMGSIAPEDLAVYPLGSILAGGSSGPFGNERAPVSEWDRQVRAFREVSLRPAANGLAIPIIFGVDAVHGHNNVPGATLFPHNIGLGAAHDVDLVRRIGAVTAAEIAGSGIEWTFAPTLAVPQDLRWGRAYEGYSSDPAIVAEYSRAMVEGLQGTHSGGQILAADKVSATAKHFLADGGTEGGKDQGDAKISEAELVRIHAAGYAPAIDAGVLTVMASFSSWNGVKHHGNRSLLTDVLKGRMGFEGFVVGDWNAHGQIPGCTPTDCPQTFEAGLDLAMAPDSWKGLYESTLAHAKSGQLPMARIEDAVRRILRVKFKLGLMGAHPIERTNLAEVGAAGHLAVAREAVAKSLVLLKNEGSVLPIRPGAKVLVAGPGADSMAMQSGGWTISWQGADVTKADFANGQTIWDGIVQAVGEAGGTAVLSEDGGFAVRPDVAIVVYGEPPYAEFQGDRPHLDYTGEGLETLTRLKDEGIPVVSVFLSGRPLFVGPELTSSDAFVAAWLPGSQGAGVADVLVARKDGTSTRDFTGRLSFSWPATCDSQSQELFPLGFGGSYAAKPTVPALVTECSLSATSAEDGIVLYDRGLKQGVYAFGGETGLVGLTGTAVNLAATAFDIAAQEDARRIEWTGPATLSLDFPTDDLPSGAALEMTYRVARAPTAPVALSADCKGCEGGVQLQSTFALAAEKDWRTSMVPVRCFMQQGSIGIAIRSAAPFVLELRRLRIVSESAQQGCDGPF